MIELSLTHDGKVWKARNESLSASGTTLADLDRELAKALIKSKNGSGLKNEKVRMSFDNSTIPEWIRQYSNHYFNRVVLIDLSEKAT